MFGCPKKTRPISYIGNMIIGLLVERASSNPPDPAEYECHGQKAVLIPTGWMDIPYAWHPATVELGIYRIGLFFIACK